MPTCTQRIRLKESINQKSQPLAETQVTDVQDFTGFFNINTFDEEIVFGRNEYSIEDENFLHRSTEGIMNLMVYYENYPLILKWLPIKCWDLSKETSEFLLKDKKKSTDLTLLPGEKELEAVLDNAEDFDILSQQGAKIANKLLAKQNTYWGK